MSFLFINAPQRKLSCSVQGILSWLSNSEDVRAETKRDCLLTGFFVLMFLITLFAVKLAFQSTKVETTTQIFSVDERFKLCYKLSPAIRIADRPVSNTIRTGRNGFSTENGRNIRNEVALFSHLHTYGNWACF